MPTHSPATWDAIERHWRLGSYTIEALGRKFGVDQSTIRHRAASRKWPKRGSQRGDVALSLRAQSDDYWQELSEASCRLRAEAPLEDPTLARDRLALIRLWQRSMTALRAFEIAKLPTAKTAPAQQILFTKADADAVVKRLERLVEQDDAAATPEPAQE